MSRSTPFLLLLLLVAPGGGLLAQPDKEAPETAWSRRARWVDGAVEADPKAVETAVTAYHRAVERRPDDPLRRAHLLRALDFQGQYLIAAGEAQREHYESARRVAAGGFRRLAERWGGDQPPHEPSPERPGARRATWRLDWLGWGFPSGSWGRWGMIPLAVSWRRPWPTTASAVPPSGGCYLRSCRWMTRWAPLRSL